MTASAQLDGRSDSTFPTGGQSSTFPNLQVAGFVAESTTDNITAHAGGGQTNAVPLTSELNRVTVVATAGDSVRLPASYAGATILIENHGANAVQVYGAGTDTVNDVATATGVSQMYNSAVIYTCYTAGAWYTNGLASGYVKGYSLQTVSSAVIAANSAATQAGGTPVTSMSNQVTSGGAGYSVTLPPSSPGMEITLHNVSGVTMSVFPNALNNQGAAGSETINALAANAALVFAANTSATLFCNIAGAWYSSPRTPS